jgi:myo-inositol 2-dehydrogenase/D-chiro-inositol 1-dehydrogenase
MRDGKVKVGIIGSQFEADIHAASFQILPEEAEVVAVASPTPGHPEELARSYGIPRVFHDYREMLKDSEIEMVTIAAPNYLHARMTIDIARSGKHVVCEKPLSMTLEEADEMIDTCRKQGVLLLYAEELFFTPKYVKAKEMADQGAFGKVYLVKQSEKHFGPHNDWFWEDDSICILEFANGAVGLVENSWARRGGMDDRIEVFGEGGVTHANLHMGNALPTYSEHGYGYAVEKAPSTRG